ncbi:MAG: hypothetical protein ACJ0DK_03295 [Planctomycetota bacterium]
MSSQESLELRYQADGEDQRVLLADKLLIGRNPGLFHRSGGEQCLQQARCGGCQRRSLVYCRSGFE